MPAPSIDSLSTPAVLVDLDVLERNISRMAARAREAGVRLRPHAKTHKCPEIGRLQRAAGAWGLSAQPGAVRLPVQSLLKHAPRGGRFSLLRRGLPSARPKGNQAVNDLAPARYRFARTTVWSPAINHKPGLTKTSLCAYDWRTAAPGR